ncbi:MAG TPA: hypothetical protein VF463_04950 [Sphingobium sp.]
MGTWEKLLSVNVTGALNCGQAVIPSMRERGGGRVDHGPDDQCRRRLGAAALTLLS